MNWKSLPSLPALRGFSAYAQTGSLQKAGDKLNVSHAAISQHIRSVEAHLGIKLLDRTGRQAQLTREGRTLADALAEGFGTIEQAVAKLTGAEQARALVLSTTASFAAGWLMPRLADFRSRHPEIDIVFDAKSELVDLLKGEADVAIRSGAGIWSGLTVTKLISTHMIAVAAPELLPKGTKVEMADLAKLPVLQEIGTSENTLWLERHGLSCAGGGGRVALPGGLTLDAARAGQGIAVTPQNWVSGDLASGKLVKLFEDPRELGYFAVSKPAPHRPALKAFLRWIKDQTRLNFAPQSK